MNSKDHNIQHSFFQKFLFRPLGLDSDNSFVIWILLLFTAILSGGLYYFDGNLPLIAGIMYLTFIFLVSMFRIDFSLYLFMLSVMIFDQYAIPNFPSITQEFYFFSNLKEIPFVPYFHTGMVGPFEIHLLFICTGLMLHMSIKKNFTFKPLAAWGAFILFFLFLVFAFLNGMRSGGDYMVALWEVRALFYFCLMYVIVPQIIDDKRQIMILFWIFILGITFKALQGVMRFVELGFTTGGFPVLTNHEDPVFIVTILILLIGFFLFNTGHIQRRWMVILSPILFLGFYVAQRRASYASLFISLIALIVILPTKKRNQFLKFFLPLMVLLTLYGAVFWNSSGTLGRPVQMIRSGIEVPDKETNFEDYSSNLYRAYENYNLAKTVVRTPVIGTGFGNKYDQPIPLVNIRFPLRDYIPHNQIYWVLVKMGAVGFFVFWFFFNSFAAKGTQVFMRLNDPYLKVVTMVIVVAIINQMVVSFFDLQLTYYRNMLYLGCLMGLLPVIIHLEPEDENKQQVQKRSSDD